MFTPDKLDRADWPLLQNGPINLFWRKSVYEARIAALEALGYRIVRLRYESMYQFTRDVSFALKWEQQFGYAPWRGGLDALNDGLRGEPFDSSDDSAVCIEDFHLLVAEDPQMGKDLLDILADQSRSYLLFGKRLIGLIQTDHRDFKVGRLGATHASFNRQDG